MVLEHRHEVVKEAVDLRQQLKAPLTSPMKAQAAKLTGKLRKPRVLVVVVGGCFERSRYPFLLLVSVPLRRLSEPLRRLRWKQVLLCGYKWSPARAGRYATQIVRCSCAHDDTVCSTV